MGSAGTVLRGVPTPLHPATGGVGSDEPRIRAPGKRTATRRSADVKQARERITTTGKSLPSYPGSLRIATRERRQVRHSHRTARDVVALGGGLYHFHRKVVARLVGQDIVLPVEVGRYDRLQRNLNIDRISARAATPVLADLDIDRISIRIATHWRWRPGEMREGGPAVP
jgi:hypothetical protein